MVHLQGGEKEKGETSGPGLGAAPSPSVASRCTPAPPGGSRHDSAPTKDGCPAGRTGNYPNYIFDPQQIFYIVYFQTVHNLIISSSKHGDLPTLVGRLFHYESISSPPFIQCSFLHCRINYSIPIHFNRSLYCQNYRYPQGLHHMPIEEIFFFIKPMPKIYMFTLCYILTI